MTGSSLTLEQRRAYALDALHNPVLGDVFTELERSILAQWRGTTDSDTAKREQAWMKFQALRDIKAAIESALNKADEAIQAEKEDEEDSH